MIHTIKNIKWVIATSLVCILLAVLTFFTFINKGFVELNETNLQILLFFDLVLLVLFFTLIAREIYKVLKERKNITVEDLFEIAKKLAAYQTLDPDIVSEHFEDNPKGIINEAINIFNEYRDGI